MAEALRCADELQPDTALVDIGLPDGDGFTLTRQLCSKPWGIRVVIFSSDADRTNVTTAKLAGAVGFLPKDQLSGPDLERLIGNQGDGDDG